MKLSIKQQQKDKNRFNLYLDGKFWLALSSQYLALKHIKEGELAPQLKQEIEEDSNKSYAYFVATRYLAQRAHSERELRQKLLRKELDETDVDGAIMRLKKEKLVDDESFAASYRRDAVNIRKESAMLSKAKLIKKGVPKDTLDAMDSSDDLESALYWASKKFRSEKSEQRILAFLSRKGFTYDVAKIATQLARDRSFPE